MKQKLVKTISSLWLKFAYPASITFEGWVVFVRDTTGLGFLVKKNFGHGFACTLNSYGLLVSIDPRAPYAQIGAVPVKPDRDIGAFLKKCYANSTVIYGKCERKCYFWKWTYYLPKLWCCGLLSYTTGLPFALTPYKLYKKLVRKYNFEEI